MCSNLPTAPAEVRQLEFQRYEYPPNDSDARTKLGDAVSGECVREPLQTSCSSRTRRYSMFAAPNSMRATCIGILLASVRLTSHIARIQTHCSSLHLKTTRTPIAHSPAQTPSGASAIGSTSPHTTFIASHCALSEGVSCSVSLSQLSCKCWQWTTRVQCRRTHIRLPDAHCGFEAQLAAGETRLTVALRTPEYAVALFRVAGDRAEELARCPLHCSGTVLARQFARVCEH